MVRAGPAGPRQGAQGMDEAQDKTATPADLEKTATPSGAGRGGSDLAPGTVLAGRYRVRQLLARGGMGQVYEAEDTELRETVALKTLDARLAADPVALERFRGEVKSARRVSHPNVCR